MFLVTVAMSSVDRTDRTAKCEPTTYHSSLLPLTNKYSYKKPSKPLLFHFLDHRLFTRCSGFAHDGEGVDMSDRAHSGRSEPRQAEKRTEGSKNDDEQKIQVEPRAFNQATFLLTDYQPDGLKEKWQTIRSFSKARSLQYTII